MENRNALESKYQRILNELGEQATFYIEDIQRIFPDMKKSTLYWNMSKLVDGGYLKRVRNGVYSFNEWKGKKNVSLSQTAEKIRDILDETGFDYYISGLDILQKYMLHIPEQYPIVICIQKESKNELTDILTNHFYEVVEPRRLKEKYEAIQYNGKNNDIIILLHGGGLSWWNYIDEISLLENEFHIVIPILDGHSGSDTNFTSIESNALEIINFINKNYNGKVKLIGGLSLGGQILLEILSKNPDICECAIIESALVMPMDFTYKMIEPIFNLSYCLISKKWFSKLQFKSLKLKKSLFALYYEDTCKITKDNLIAFMKSNSNYEVKNTLSHTKAKTLVLVGSKERPIMKKSATKIVHLIPNSELEVLQGYYHGDISINHADDYVERVKRLVR